MYNLGAAAAAAATGALPAPVLVLVVVDRGCALALPSSRLRRRALCVRMSYSEQNRAAQAFPGLQALCTGVYTHLQRPKTYLITGVPGPLKVVKFCQFSKCVFDT